MTTTGDTVVIERIPALPTTHYEFELRQPVVCVCRDACWVVQFGYNGTGPMIYAFGDPGEPLAVVTKVFFEAVCATWCGALRAEQELPTLKMPHGEPPPVGCLPPYPDAKSLTIDDELPREEQSDADEAAEIWTGDEMRSALALLHMVREAWLTNGSNDSHHKRCRWASRKLERKHIEYIEERLRSRYKNSIFW